MSLAAVLWLACAVTASIIGSQKGEAVTGFLTGALLGPVGVLLALLSSGDRTRCPHCKEPIRKRASVCPHCRQGVAVRKY